MILLFCKPDKKRLKKRLLKAIGESAIVEGVEDYETIESLTNRLRLPKYDLDSIVLLADSRKTLNEILSISEYYERLRIILILPDQEKETISKGHKLLPRYVSYVDRDFSSVAAVLEKMKGETFNKNNNTKQVVKGE